MIRLEHISKTYSLAGKTVHALNDVSLQIHQGEVFGIIGRSGAGKSTLIRMLNLLEQPSSGQVWVQDQDITRFSGAQLRAFRQGVGMVFQHFNLLHSRTVLDNVCFPLRLAGVDRAQRHARALEVLELVGLKDHANKYPRQLSGGQQQRVGIARALANRPQLLLCDEATSALDPETTQSILRLLREINQELGLTIVLITHGMDVIRSVCDRVAVIDAGKIVECGEVLDVFLHPHHPTTQSLLSESGVNADDWHALAEGVTGSVMRLSVRGVATTEPLISRITSQLGLNVSILQGAIGRIKTEPYGQLVVAVQGDAQAKAGLDALLTELNVQFEVLRP
ncbi:methionine ABC transporter ATP-binding protein [Alcaligenes nematophilus]|uniref:Cell division ATP-binding protein FtsE n=2 Tax=Alcaligenes TaxID=507 RepID=A0AAE9KP08_ALCFA|nr:MULTISPECIES: methionine ABC transporter ATP-binding protein [Alcaligenes]MDH4867713.1 methionine ABC transporter ATP-binding protein [Bacillus cereus]MCR4145390.1 methionine ABC transporter ATP-binding protein [Alcaligenes faecalis]MCX5471252.1 methionine ABC transporter ATP-binding protein [Alcaligenes nematophilus]MDY7129022.1 methionine ABC transporter ATP-binding protein [Alcaligenes nematophilus]UPL20675.1 methionine ABC transporter ATP-binding protein [Alcaligenes faecalis]